MTASHTQRGCSLRGLGSRGLPAAPAEMPAVMGWLGSGSGLTCPCVCSTAARTTRPNEGTGRHRAGTTCPSPAGTAGNRQSHCAYPHPSSALGAWASRGWKSRAIWRWRGPRRLCKWKGIRGRGVTLGKSLPIRAQTIYNIEVALDRPPGPCGPTRTPPPASVPPALRTWLPGLAQLPGSSLFLYNHCCGFHSCPLDGWSPGPAWIQEKPEKSHLHKDAHGSSRSPSLLPWDPHPS